MNINIFFKELYDWNRMADYFLVAEPINPKHSPKERKDAKIGYLQVSIIIFQSYLFIFCIEVKCFVEPFSK